MYLLNDSGLQFVKKYFATLFHSLRLENLTSTAYNFQTNGQPWRYYCMLGTRLLHFLSDNQKDCDSCVQRCTQSNSTRAYRVKWDLFNIILTREVSSAEPFDRGASHANNVEGDTQNMSLWLQRTASMNSAVLHQLLSVIWRNECDCDKNIRQRLTIWDRDSSILDLSI